MPSSGWFALFTQTALPRYRHKIPSPSNSGRPPHPVRAEGRPNQKQERERHDRDFPRATSISIVSLISFDRLVREHSRRERQSRRRERQSYGLSICTKTLNIRGLRIPIPEY